MKYIQKLHSPPQTDEITIMRWGNMRKQHKNTTMGIYGDMEHRIFGSLTPFNPSNVRTMANFVFGYVDQHIVYGRRYERAVFNA